MKFHDDIEAMDEAYMSQQQGTAQPLAVASGHAPLPSLPIYPLALAQVDVPAAVAENLITRRVGPLPVWGWGLSALALGGLGYFVYKTSKSDEVEPNDREDETPRLPASSGKWEPGRTAFADDLRAWLKSKNLSTGATTIYTDADEASKKLKHVSPLVTMKTTADLPMKELEKFCKKEGLIPVPYDGGAIGFHPAPNTKRGHEWEEYVDYLRDNGQKI